MEKLTEIKLTEITLAWELFQQGIEEHDLAAFPERFFLNVTKQLVWAIREREHDCDG